MNNTIRPPTRHFIQTAMNHPFVFSIGVLVLLLMLTAPVLAQQRGEERRAVSIFDPATVETVRGVITRIDSVESRRGPSTGIHLQLQTSGEVLAVHLGPSWYVEEQSFAPQVNDSLTVHGSRVMVQNAPAIIAAEVLHNERSLRLRDTQGRPVWRGQRPR